MSLRQPATRVIVSCAATVSLLLAARFAHADTAQPLPPPPPPPPGAASVSSSEAPPAYVPAVQSVSGPKILPDWSEGDPLPPGYRRVERTRRGLVIGGAVTFGVMYMLSVFVALPRDSDAKALWIPCLGPFVQWATAKNNEDETALLLIDGLAQGAGMFMLVYGLTSPKVVAMREDVARTPIRIQPLPLVGHGHTGLGVVGTF